MAKVLVTGGAGFIGSHVTDRLVESGHDVTVLDDLSGGFVENVNASARFVEGSVIDRDLVGRLFDESRFEYVYHLAAYAAEGLSHFIKRFNYENNLMGSINLINASVNGCVRCFVFTSSIAVYGQNQLPMREDMIPVPEDPYGIAKLAVEQELKVTKEMFGLDFIVFRPHNVYGERQNIGDRYRNVIGIFMNQILQGLELTIFGDGGQTRAFTHVDDISSIIADSPFVPEALNEIFNVGADGETSVAELASMVAGCLGVEAKIRNLPERKEVRHAFADHAKAWKTFGKQAGVSLRDGIGRMAKWAAGVGAKKSKPFGEIEIMKNMPPSWLKE